MSTPRKDLPSVTSGNFQQRLRETLQTYLGRQGDPLDRGITLRDLLETGLARLRDGRAVTSGSGVPPITLAVPERDLTSPPQPTGFTTSAAISHIFVEHDAPIYTQGHGHLRTRVYGVVYTGGDLPVFAHAVEIHQFSGTLGTIASNPGTTWRLWLKWESADGVLSATPAGGTNGVEAVTGADVSSMVEAMTGEGNPFVILTEPATIGGYDYPAGTYSVRSFILDAQVGSAQIAELAVNDAHIASLAVGKLLAGSIAVGQYIQSTGYVPGSEGWRIDGEGAAEFSGVIVRGTIYASAGHIGGSDILSDAMQSSNFDEGAAGWRLKSNGDIEVNAGVFRGTLDVKSRASGARLEITNDHIHVYDAGGVLRVEIGELAP